MVYVKKKRKPCGHQALETWATLNKHVTKLDEAGCRKMLAVEKAHRNRRQYLGRLLSRLNRVRRARERRELTKGSK